MRPARFKHPRFASRVEKALFAFSPLGTRRITASGITRKRSTPASPGRWVFCAKCCEKKSRRTVRVSTFVSNTRRRRRQESLHSLARTARDQNTLAALTARPGPPRRHTRASHHQPLVVATASAPRSSASHLPKPPPFRRISATNFPVTMQAVTLPPHVLLDVARRPRQAKRLGVQVSAPLAEPVSAPPQGTRRDTGASAPDSSRFLYSSSRIKRRRAFPRLRRSRPAPRATSTER